MMANLKQAESGPRYLNKYLYDLKILEKNYFYMEWKSLKKMRDMKPKAINLKHFIYFSYYNVTSSDTISFRKIYSNKQLNWEVQ